MPLHTAEKFSALAGEHRSNDQLDVALQLGEMVWVHAVAAVSSSRLGGVGWGAGRVAAAMR